jgi:hypothetical protein
MDSGIPDLTQNSVDMCGVNRLITESLARIKNEKLVESSMATEPVAAEDFKLKRPDPWIGMKLVYAKPRVISGLPCFVKVFAEHWFRFTSIQVFVISGEIMAIKPPPDLLELGSSDPDDVVYN